ncbi:MAG: ATP-binding protein [Oscillibacter sp.]
MPVSGRAAGVPPGRCWRLMRQPLEDGTVTSGPCLRRDAAPAQPGSMLVCAMNPCRCGWRGHPSGRCTCSDR